MRRLNSQGMLSEAGKRWFVCEALADRHVQVERFDGKLLVSFRNMYIREIDPQQQSSLALVMPRPNSAGAAPVALRAPSAAPADQTFVPEQTLKV